MSLPTNPEQSGYPYPHSGYGPDQAPRKGIPIWARLLIGCFSASLLSLSILMVIVFVQALEKARSASCRANSIQIGLGLMMYAQDFDERFPPAAHWQSDIMPYIKSDAPFICPSAKGAKNGFAYNNKMGAVKSRDLPIPRFAVVAFETAQDQKDAHGGPEIVATPRRHQRGNYYIFADGYAKWFADSNRPDFSPTAGKP